MTVKVENVPFCIDEKAYCVWDDDLAGKNRRFVRGIAPDYFSYIASSIGSDLTEGRQVGLAATHLRATYLHSLETAFAITFSALQAPSCVFGWLARYRQEQLRILVEKAQAERHIPNRLKIHHCSWKAIAEKFLAGLPTSVAIADDKHVDRSSICSGFTEALGRMAADFQKEESVSEYNAVKHGFRISQGGFSLGFRPETVPGIEDPSQPLTMLGSSEHGTSAYVLRSINDSKIHFGVSVEARNWDAFSLIGRLQVVSLWLGVVKAALRGWLGDTEPPSSFRFLPTEDAYVKPWNNQIPVSNFKISTITLAREPEFSENDIIQTYKSP